MIRGLLLTFQLPVQVARLAPGALATILVRIFRPTLHLGVAFTTTLLVVVLVVMVQLARSSSPVSFLPFR